MNTDVTVRSHRHAYVGYALRLQRMVIRMIIMITSCGEVVSKGRGSYPGFSLSHPGAAWQELTPSDSHRRNMFVALV